MGKSFINQDQPNLSHTKPKFKKTVIGKRRIRTYTNCNIFARNFESERYNFLGYSEAGLNALQAPLDLNALQEQNIAFK